MTETDSKPKIKKRPMWLRLVAVACVGLTAWHVFATFLWVSPSSELRNAVPGNALRAYMQPMFGQSWSVFAPKPIDGDYSFEVRATLEDANGKREATQWVDAVNLEMDMIHHNLFPPRASLAGNQLASDYRSRWQKLNDEQKNVVELGYFKGDNWSKRLGDELIERANQSGSSQKSTKSFIESERVASAYATQVAKALWGQDVSSVQFRAGRQGVIPFEQRNDPEAQRPDVVTIDSGWRGLTVIEGQNEQNFAEVFNSLEGVK